MDTLEEFRNVSPLRSPSLALARANESTCALKTPQSLSRSPTARSGRVSPSTMLEMSVTEQIARKTRKSTVLDQKNALMILAIPDYDDYKIMQPYSCRSLSNKIKFLGGRDFITRHNPQEVNDFKMQYSRDVGTLSRQRSVLAPPNTLLVSPCGSSSGKSFKLAGFQTLASVSNNQQREDRGLEIWKRVLTSGKKPCWILTEFGVNQLIGPEYCITTRLALPTACHEPSPLTHRSPLRSESPFTSSTARASARVGLAVDLADEHSLGALSRTAMYSPASRPPSPLRSPYREPALLAPASRETARTLSTRSSRSRPDGSSPLDIGSTVSETENWVVYSATLPPLRSTDTLRGEESSSVRPVCTTATSPTLLPFAMEVSPCSVTLADLAVGEVYIFPVRIRNVGTKQERFRVKHLSASVGSSAATIAEASYDKDAARLAAGLAAIITVTVSFAHRGRITGHLHVDTEGVGACEVRIEGSVR